MKIPAQSGRRRRCRFAKREPYIIRHGQGYSVFEHTSHGISQELLVFAPLDAPVKISLLRLRNRTDRKRRLSVTNYNELVLGVIASTSAPYIITEIDQPTATIFARNPFNNEFAESRRFRRDERTALRARPAIAKSFIGRNGSLDAARPRLRRVGLAGRDGAGLDPCAALQTID